MTGASAIARAFDLAASDLPGSGTPAADVRAASLQRFTSLGFPSVRSEEWRYTSLAALAAAPWELPAPKIGAAPAAWLGSHLLVFWGGVFQPSLSRLGSLPEGVRVESLSKLPAAEWVQDPEGARSLTSLNTALAADGILVDIANGKKLAEPIEVLWLGDGEHSLVHERLIVRLGRHAEVSLLERSEGESGSYWRNPVSRFRLGEGARLKHVRVQAEAPEAFHTAWIEARLDSGSRFESHSLQFGARLGRVETEVWMGGSGAEVVLGGLALSRGGQHLDHRTFVDHARPHGHSEQLYKGVYGGDATGSFDGKVLVRREAQATDAAQENRNLLLSRDAQVYTRPQLEIYADDVKCSHGATTGQLDGSALFYLRSRGLDRVAAERLLTLAFAREVLDRLPFRQVADEADRRWLTSMEGR